MIGHQLPCCQAEASLVKPGAGLLAARMWAAKR